MVTSRDMPVRFVGGRRGGTGSAVVGMYGDAFDSRVVPESNRAKEVGRLVRRICPFGTTLRRDLIVSVRVAGL